MRNTRMHFARLLAVGALLAAAACAQAQPGDAEAVAKARREYAAAMQGNDPGLQNAMRVQLEYQLAQAKERVRLKQHARSKPEHSSHLPTREHAMDNNAYVIVTAAR